MNISARDAQQGVVLLSLAQQEVSIGEPVTGFDALFSFLDALLIDVDADLLDCAARFALRLGQAAPLQRVDLCEGVCACYRCRGDSLGVWASTTVAVDGS